MGPGYEGHVGLGHLEAHRAFALVRDVHRGRDELDGGVEAGLEVDTVVEAQHGEPMRPAMMMVSDIGTVILKLLSKFMTFFI